MRYRGALPTARNKTQAEQTEAKIILEMHQSEYGGRRSSPTLNDFVDRVFVPWARVNRRSWKSDEGRLKSVKRFFGSKRLSEISPFLIERFKVERRNSKVHRPEAKWRTPKLRSVASVNRELSLLSRIFSIAITNKEAVTNPCRDVKHIRGEQPGTRYLLPDEETRLMAVLIGKRSHLKPIVVLAIHTGVRRGELLRLRWEHVDFYKHEIKVTHTKTDRDRFVPMNSRVLQQLLSLRGEPTEGFVFPNHKTGYNVADIKTAFNAACREAGIHNLHFHDLRHAFGTRAADAGAPINAIAAVMGHADIHTTMRYSHATDEGKRKVVQALEQAAVRWSQNGHNGQSALAPVAVNS